VPVGKKELAERFGFHAATEETGSLHDDVRTAHYELAKWIDANVPDGRHKSLALTALEESMHWSNAAVAMAAPLVGAIADD
jgi:hypothetical protein